MLKTQRQELKFAQKVVRKIAVKLVKNSARRFVKKIA